MNNELWEWFWIWSLRVRIDRSTPCWWISGDGTWTSIQMLFRISSWTIHPSLQIPRILPHTNLKMSFYILMHPKQAYRAFTRKRSRPWKYFRNQRTYGERSISSFEQTCRVFIYGIAWWSTSTIHHERDLRAVESMRLRHPPTLVDAAWFYPKMCVNFLLTTSIILWSIWWRTIVWLVMSYTTIPFLWFQYQDTICRHSKW